MILPKRQIEEMLETGELSINPILDRDTQIEAAKVDLRLDNEFERTVEEQDTHHDTLSDEYSHLEPLEVPFGDKSAEDEERRGKFILHPNQFVLAQTFEYVDLPNDIMGILGGRSGLGRHGVVVHATASVIDPGYTGNITLELTNYGNIPVIMYPRQRVATILFARVEEEVEEYGGKFGGSSGPRPSGQDEDLDILEHEI